MEIKTIIDLLRRKLNLSEAQASEQAYAMAATIKGRHPRLKITAMVIDGQIKTVCLENGTQVRFDPSYPVPVWNYAEKTHSMNPATKNISYLRVLDRIEGLQRKIRTAKSDQEKTEAQAEIDALLKKRKAKSVDDLEKRLEAAAAAERGVTIDE